MKLRHWQSAKTWRSQSQYHPHHHLIWKLFVSAFHWYIFFCLFVSYFRKLKSALPFFNAWTLRFSGDSNEFYAGDTTAPVLALHCSETSCVWRPRNRKKILKTMTELTLWILKASTCWCSLVHNLRFFYRNIFDFVKKSLTPWRRFLS